jgi:hypothetical protein
VQLLGTLDGMEPVVKGTTDRPDFLGSQGSQAPGAGKDVSDALDRIRQHWSAH